MYPKCVSNCMKGLRVEQVLPVQWRILSALMCFPLVVLEGSQASSDLIGCDSALPSAQPLQPPLHTISTRWTSGCCISQVDAVTIPQQTPNHGQGWQDVVCVCVCACVSPAHLFQSGLGVELFLKRSSSFCKPSLSEVICLCSSSRVSYSWRICS